MEIEIFRPLKVFRSAFFNVTFKDVVAHDDSRERRSREAKSEEFHRELESKLRHVRHIMPPALIQSNNNFHSCKSVARSWSELSRCHLSKLKFTVYCGWSNLLRRSMPKCQCLRKRNACQPHTQRTVWFIIWWLSARGKRNWWSWNVCKSTGRCRHHRRFMARLGCVFYEWKTTLKF